MFKTFFEEHTLWGLRARFAKLLQQGEQATRDFEVRLQLHKIKSQRISADGFPATAREHISGLQIPINRWNTFRRPIDAYALTHMDKEYLKTNIRIAEELIADINLPLPDVRQPVNTEREKQIREDMRHYTVEIEELSRAMDELLMAVGGIPTNPLFLEIGKLKKEGYLLLGTPPRHTMEQLIQHREKLHVFVQRAQRVLTQDLRNPSQ
jgi:hypothetical protein